MSSEQGSISGPIADLGRQVNESSVPPEGFCSVDITRILSLIS
jgi:hypothetical protein